MKLINDNPRMSDALLPAATVNVVTALTPTAETSLPGPGPLRYAYTSTRVQPDVRERLRRVPQVVNGDGALAETFRMLRGQVLPRMRADGHQVLAVTSARRVEGKSLTALNLALTLAADLDTSVLLIDAELDGTGLQRLLGLAGQAGLAQQLLDDQPLSELLVNPGVERFVFLPAGSAQVANSSELLAARSANHLVQEMKRRYADRIIVVDLPPLLDTADALAFLPWADTSLFVVETFESRVQDLESATELLAPFNLIGTVMSQPPLKKPSQRKGWFSRLRGR